MAKKPNLLSHLLLVSFIHMAASADEVDDSTRESLHSWPAFTEPEAVSLLQRKGAKRVKVGYEEAAGVDLLRTNDSVTYSQHVARVAQKDQPAPADDLMPASCKHDLSGVTGTSVLAALAHQGDPPIISSARTSPLHKLQHQRIFIAVCLHESEAIISHWIFELIRLVMALRVPDKPQQLFVSVYESGSLDQTPRYLQTDLKEHLKFLGVPSRIITGGVVRNGMARIQFLADIRNKAMEPLQASQEPYDRVLWLSDNIFCADGVLQILAHALPEKQGGLGADAVCGMDYWYFDKPPYENGDQCAFYDKWATHDIAGNNFGNDWPIVRTLVNGTTVAGPDNAKLDAGIPFQVFSCWNGMLAFSADIFQKQRLAFRTHREEKGECAVAETELIFRDMWTLGRGRIAISPKATSAYNLTHWSRCAADKQPTTWDEPAPITWQPEPEFVRCCPLRPDWNVVDFTQCFQQEWKQPDSQPGEVQAASLYPPDWNSFLTFHTVDQIHKSLLSAQTDVRYDFNLTTACVLVVFVACAFVHLKGLKGNVKECNLQALFLFWMATSLLMNLLNKQCTLILACPLTLVVIQMLVTIVLLAWTPLSGIRMEDLWRWCALALLFGLMLVSSMFAFTHASVTCLLILRNCQPILTLVVEKAALPNAPQISISVVMSLMCILFGAMLYAHFAPGYSITSDGLGWIFLNCVATVAHRVLERHLLTSDMKLSFEAMTLINNVVPLVPICMLAWATGETQQLSSHAHLLSHSPMATAVIICSGVVGLCLGQSSIMVQACVSATSMTVLQTMNKLFIILAAMFVFQERFTPLSCIGCALSLLGCVAYGMAQQAAKQSSLELGPSKSASTEESAKS